MNERKFLVRVSTEDDEFNESPIFDCGFSVKEVIE